MSKYEIIAVTMPTGETKHVIRNNESATQKPSFFVEYNFMGGVDWNTDRLAAYHMDLEEAQQILEDLEAADEPKTMKRIEVLRALAAAHSAFRAELKKYGIEMGTWQPGKPYTLYIDNGPTKPNTILGEYDYKQKIDERIH